MAANTNSPLRYPGGKAKMFKYTEQLIKQNNVLGCTYVEPFAGGAGLALSLLFNNTVNRLILNDIDRSIYAFWHSILNNTEQFCELILNSPVTMDEWYRQREFQLIKDDINLLTLGFSTFFLNRTNRSGIIKGGVIGGQDQSGVYKLDCRFNKEDLIKRIEKISSLRDRILFYNMDCIEFINQVIANIEEQAFIFLDPPYYKKGPSLYENHFTHEDHVQLNREITGRINHKWVVTYDNVDVLKDIYNGYTIYEYDLSYTAANKYKGKEIMIYSNNLVPLEFNII
jgi:DNA adenine methylase